jgi:hypothetical protein
MSEKLSEQIVKASEAYAQKTWLRAAINLIPYIGGSLDVVLTSRGSLHQKRFFELLEGLKKEMSLIKEDKIDRAYLESEEFSDILLKVIEASLKTRNRDKIRLYAKFLRGAILIQNRNQLPLEDYLATLTELTPAELEVARAIYKQQFDYEPNSIENILQWAWKKGWNDLPNQVTNVSKEDLPFVLLRIQKSGFIRELTGAYVGYEGGVYVITDVFRKIMQFIGDDVQSSK